MVTAVQPNGPGPFVGVGEGVLFGGSRTFSGVVSVTMRRCAEQGSSLRRRRPGPGLDPEAAPVRGRCAAS